MISLRKLLLLLAFSHFGFAFSLSEQESSSSLIKQGKDLGFLVSYVSTSLHLGAAHDDYKIICLNSKNIKGLQNLAADGAVKKLKELFDEKRSMKILIKFFDDESHNVLLEVIYNLGKKPQIILCAAPLEVPIYVVSLLEATFSGSKVMSLHAKLGLGVAALGLATVCYFGVSKQNLSKRVNYTKELFGEPQLNSDDCAVAVANEINKKHGDRFLAIPWCLYRKENEEKDSQQLFRLMIYLIKNCTFDSSYYDLGQKRFGGNWQKNNEYISAALDFIIKNAGKKVIVVINPEKVFEVLKPGERGSTYFIPGGIFDDSVISKPGDACHKNICYVFVQEKGPMNLIVSMLSNAQCIAADKFYFKRFGYYNLAENEDGKKLTVNDIASDIVKKAF